MAVAAALSGVVGAGIGGASGIGQSFLSDQWAQSASARQRHWEEMMYDTRYQRAVTDLKSAGLNPALAYVQGIAGGTPSASAPSARADFGDVGGGFERGVATAKALRTQQANVDTAEAVRDKSRADAQAASSNARVAENNAVQADTLRQYWPTMQMDKSMVDWENMTRSRQLLDLEIQGSTADNYRKRLENTIRGWDANEAAISGRFDLSERGQKAIQFRRFMDAFNPFMSHARGAASYSTRTGGLWREKGED